MHHLPARTLLGIYSLAHFAFGFFLSERFKQILLGSALQDVHKGVISVQLCDGNPRPTLFSSLLSSFCVKDLEGAVNLLLWVLSLDKVQEKQ